MSDLTLNDSMRPAATASLRQYRELLSRYLKPQMGWVIFMAVVLLAEIALKLINPQVLRYFLDTAQAGGAPRSLYLSAGVFLTFAILQQVMSLVTHYTAAQVGWSSTNQLRADLALHILRLDMPFHKTRTPGELIDRADGDVTHLSNFLSIFTVNVVGNGLLVLGILLLLFRENAWVGLGMVVYTLLTLLVLRSIQKLAVPRWAAERQSSAMLYGYIEERISGAEEIRAAGAESYVMRRLYEYMRDFTRKTRSAVVVSSLTYNLTNLVYVLGYAAGLAIGVLLYVRGEASLGTAYLITYYVGMLSDPLQSIRGQAEDLQQAAANIQRINELFNLRPRVGDPLSVGTSQRISLPAGPLPVRFEKVSFRYDDNNNSSKGSLGEENHSDQGNALSDVSFKIQAGRVLGILGRTGSGKSTLTRLLFRLYDPNLGSIQLADTN
ncbi:MAG TPA: ABC transporter ATP-binding protein, partial [Anaerolineales bacterium]